MAIVQSTKTNKAAAPQAPAQEMTPTNTAQAQPTPPVEDTAAEVSTPEPAAGPARQPAVEPSAPAAKGDSDCPATGDDPGRNMTTHEYDALHGSAKTLEPYAASLRPIQDGLTPRQEITAIIAGGVISGILARTKPYEMLDLRKAAEAIGMCDTLVDMILHLDDPAPVGDELTGNS